MIVRQNLAELLDRPLGSGCPVTSRCRIRREPISIATNTYRTRNEEVTDTKSLRRRWPAHDSVQRLSNAGRSFRADYPASDTCRQFAERLEYPVSGTAHSRSSPRPMLGFRGPSDKPAPEGFGQRWTSWLARLPAPKHLEGTPMPSEELSRASQLQAHRASRRTLLAQPSRNEIRPLSGVALPCALGTLPSVFEGKDSRPPGQRERKGIAG